MLKRLIFVLFSSFLISQASAQSNNPYLEALPNWEAVLAKFVDDQGRVDFLTLANDVSELETFVLAIEQVSPASHPELEKF